MALKWAVLVATLGVAIGAGPAWSQAAQKYEPPRTSAGKPDLQGVWSSATATAMERPAGYPLVISREQADAIEGGTLFNQRMKTQASYVDPNEGAPEKGKPLPPVGNYDVAYTDPGAHVISIGGELRSSWVVYPENGKIPALTKEGKAIQDASPRKIGSGYDHPEERGLGERCILMSGGPPFRSGLYNNNVQIVQTPEHVMMMVEMVHDVRIARFTDQHRSDGIAQWMGDPIARWHGDTLVVETMNMHPDQRSERTVMSVAGKITERFTRISDRQILYQFEINDPATYTSVWRGETALNRLDDTIFEFACHEGNYGLTNILSGGRQNDLKGVSQKAGAEREE
ncbi:MAG: hypothetical protein Q8R82_09650 [Hyphomonadaceae bacterium]|nr:hypothetical protein [Hyphomonadaceae bacterium]